MTDFMPDYPSVPKERVLNPLSDLFTRWLFGEEHHKALLTDFVNSVLVRKGEGKVRDLELKNPFNIRDAVQAKESILDVRAIDSSGRSINLEVQLGQQPDYIPCSLYYWSAVYHRQLAGGATYRKLEPVICINLLGFVLFPDLKEWHNCFHITEQNHPAYLLSAIQIWTSRIFGLSAENRIKRQSQVWREKIILRQKK